VHALRFHWWGNLFVPLSEEDRKLIGPQDGKWGNPHNWLVDGRPGTGKTPGSREDDVVVIQSSVVNIYPEDPQGRIAELHMAGSGASLGLPTKPSALRIRSLLLLDGAGDMRPFSEVHFTIEETARLTFRGGNNIGTSLVENHGQIEAVEEGARLSGGYIDNRAGISLRKDSILGPSVVHNGGTLSKIDTSGVAVLFADLTNAPSGTIQVKGGVLHLQSGSVWNSGVVWVEGATDTALQIGGGAGVTRMYQLAGGQVRGTGMLVIGSSLEVLGDCTVENIEFGRGNLVGVLRGPGRLAVTGRMRVRGGGAWLEGTYDATRNEIIDVSPSLDLMPGAECLIEAEVLLGRRFDNHGHIQALAGLGVTADISGRPALLANHSDGFYEGYPPGRQWGGWSLGTCTNAGQMILRGGGLGYGQIAYTNAGTMKVQDGHWTPQHFRQTAGVLDISSNALVSVYGRGELVGGVVSGEGALRFAGLDSGVVDCLVRPGNSNGVLTIHGLSSATERTALGSNAVVEIELRGRAVGLEYDQLKSEGGYLGMSGVLRIILADSFIPAAGDRFRVVQYGTIGWYGRYEKIELPTLPGALKWSSRYESDGIQLSVTEPVVMAASLASDGEHIELSWPDRDGVKREIEVSDGLNPPNWRAIESPSVDKDGRTRVVIPIQAGIGSRFFRVREAP